MSDMIANMGFLVAVAVTFAAAVMVMLNQRWPAWFSAVDPRVSIYALMVLYAAIAYVLLFIAADSFANSLRDIARGVIR